MLNSLKKSLKKSFRLSSLTAGLMMACSEVMAGPTLGTGGGTAFTLARTWMQNFVDFISGPFGTAAVIVSIVLAFIMWSYAPKDGIMGPLVRVATSAIVVINVATWLASFNG